MVQVQGIIRNGRVQSAETLDAYEGQPVLITLPDADAEQGTDYDALDALIARCQIDTGIPDLAHEHEHYRLGVPKKGDRTPEIEGG